MVKKPPRKTQRKKKVDTKNQAYGPVARTAGSGTSSDPTHEEVARRAHQLWLDSGCQPNCEQHHWLEAERQLRVERQSETS